MLKVIKLPKWTKGKLKALAYINEANRIIKKQRTKGQLNNSCKVIIPTKLKRAIIQGYQD